MLLILIDFLSQFNKNWSVFNYLTLRSMLSTVTAFSISLIVGPWMIRKLKIHKIGQSVRHDGPQSHLDKSGTPTMGGALILVSIVLSSLLWANLTNRYIFVSIFVLITFGSIGWVDDWRKIVEKNSKGLASRWKFLWQVIFGLLSVLMLYFTAVSDVEITLFLPFIKNFTYNLGLMFIPISLFVIIGSSNAVNLTDGLDGLAILPSVLVAFGLGIFCYASGHLEFANYLLIPYIPGTGELTVMCASLIGAGLGFLWFNTYPAQVFMGDVGALAIGAFLGVIAVIVRQEAVFAIMGGLFVVETISVILQVVSFKLTGKRIFIMAPLHHHYELKGLHESTVVVRCWIVTVGLVLMGLATLKLR